MKNLLIKLMALVLIATTLITLIPISASADDFDNVVTVDITGFDCKTTGGKVFVYPNDSDKARYIKADEYRVQNFYGTSLMVFNADGLLVEVGGNIKADGPQVGVTVPAGGFMVALISGTKLDKCVKYAKEDAMFYNSTIAVVREVRGSYEDNKLTVKYNNAKPVSDDAISFLFVGNSSTYYSGTPIMFRALAEAAGVEVEVVYSTFGSAFLSEFADANHDRGKFLRNKLNERKYDYVVLQDAAGRDYNSSKPSVATLLPLIEANGAEALLYMRYSAASTTSQIISNATKHYNNYAGLAKDYGLVCSPSAEAFIYSAVNHPDINLYADDGGHHSKEGAYLAACTWLYSYLGINPVGNTFTAHLPEETAKNLQECARKACAEGYFDRDGSVKFITGDKAVEDESSEVVESAEEIVSSEAESSDDVQEPENKSIAWLYWVIGGVVVVVGAVTVILITKKKK
ncbi:MAG: hypothetical protein IJC20_03395 [Clostridia bacterium]|nr:hypothetical protein [Clostridia bacterium]